MVRAGRIKQSGKLWQRINRKEIEMRNKEGVKLGTVYYKASVYCENCNYKDDSLLIKIGQPVDEAKCPNCGCMKCLKPSGCF